jgi:hypothetical protein
MPRHRPLSAAAALFAGVAALVIALDDDGTIFLTVTFVVAAIVWAVVAATMSGDERTPAARTSTLRTVALISVAASAFVAILMLAS